MLHMERFKTFIKKDTLKKINVLTFMLALFVVMVVSAFRYNPMVISYVENRRLADFPKISKATYFSGEYTDQIERFLVDHFPRRDDLIRLTSALETLRGFSSKDDLVVVSTTGANEGEVAVREKFKFEHDATHFPDDIGMLKVTPMIKGVDVAKVEFDEQFKTNILIYDQKAMTSFMYHEAYINRLAEAYNKLESKWPGLKIYAMTAPSAVAYVNEDYSRYTDDQYEGISTLYAELDPSIVTIDVYPVLKDHQDEYLYFNTDHHWTSLGAYYAYVTASHAMGFDANALTTYKEEDYDAFLGSLYNMTQNPILKDNEDNIVAYEPTNKVTYTVIKENTSKAYDELISQDILSDDYEYHVFLGGEFGLSTIDNIDMSQTDETLLIMKDSYGNALVPYFVDHYKQIVIYDPRYTTKSLSDIIADYNIDKMMVVNSAQALASESYIQMIENLN